MTDSLSTKAPSFSSIQTQHSLQFHSQKLFSEVFPNSPSHKRCFCTSRFNLANTGHLQIPGTAKSQEVATKCLRKKRKCWRWATSPRSPIPQSSFSLRQPGCLSTPELFSASRQPNMIQSWRSRQIYCSHYLPCARRGLRTD